jgi:hypothetical protein
MMSDGGSGEGGELVVVGGMQAGVTLLLHGGGGSCVVGRGRGPGGRRDADGFHGRRSVAEGGSAVPGVVVDGG